jgi:hypothetical protein
MRTVVLSDPSGLFGVDRAALVVDALAAPGVYPVTIGVTVESQSYEVSQTIRIRAPLFFKTAEGEVRAAHYTRADSADALALRV